MAVSALGRLARKLVGSSAPVFVHIGLHGFEHASNTLEFQPEAVERSISDTTSRTFDPDSAHFDADLQAVIEAWPTLADDVKGRILAIVEGRSDAI